MTQERAREANNNGSSFAIRLGEVKDMSGAELETEVNKLDKEFNGANMSAVKKADLKVSLDALKARVLAEKKKKQAAMAGKIVSDAAVAMKAAAEGGKNKTVFVLEAGVTMDGKVAKDVFKQLGKEVPTVAVMIFSADVAKNSFCAFAGAPKALKDVDCKKWVNDAFEGLGGRGGGKKDNAQMTVQGAVDFRGAKTKAEAAC